MLTSTTTTTTLTEVIDNDKYNDGHKIDNNQTVNNSNCMNNVDNNTHNIDFLNNNNLENDL
eukprot:scaffold313916_cov24-Prasinocladus_malaysianus.AAC.1